MKINKRHGGRSPCNVCEKKHYSKLVKMTTKSYSIKETKLNKLSNIFN